VKEEALGATNFSSKYTTLAVKFQSVEAVMKKVAEELSDAKTKMMDGTTPNKGKAKELFENKTKEFREAELEVRRVGGELTRQLMLVSPIAKTRLRVAEDIVWLEERNKQIELGIVNRMSGREIKTEDLDIANYTIFKKTLTELSKFEKDVSEANVRNRAHHF
jgi:hypothetical protein